MKKQAFAYLIIAAAALSAVNLLISCAPKRGDSGSSATGSPRPQLAASPAVSSTPEEKGLESMQVDPATLSIYKEQVAPLMQNIKGELGSQFERFFKIKNWYLGEFDFAKLDKDVVTFQLVKNSQKRLSVQTHRAVMISKVDFEALSHEEQGQVLVRELVMSLYLLKFMPFEEWCQVTTPIDGASNCSDATKKALDKVAPPEKARALNENDQANVSFVTSWILRNAKQQSVDEKRLWHVLLSKGFDKRLFSAERVNQLPTLKVSSQEVMQSIAKASAAKTLPNICVGLTSDKVVWCNLEIIEANTEPHNSAFPTFVLRVKAEKDLNIEFSNLLPGELELKPNRDDHNQIIFSLPLSSLRKPYLAGDLVYTGHLLFRKDASGLTLESVLLKYATVVSTNKARTPICEVEAMPDAKLIAEDSIIIRKQGAAGNSVEKLFSEAPPFLNCLPRQVIE